MSYRIQLMVLQLLEEEINVDSLVILKEDISFSR